MEEDRIIKEIQTLKNYIDNQKDEIEILNKRMDQILEEVNYIELKKNCNLL